MVKTNNPEEINIDEDESDDEQTIEGENSHLIFSAQNWRGEGTPYIL